MFTEYKSVSSAEKEEFDKKCNELSKDGWVALSNPTITSFIDSTGAPRIVMFQQFLKYRTEASEEFAKNIIRFNTKLITSDYYRSDSAAELRALWDDIYQKLRKNFN